MSEPRDPLPRSFAELDLTPLAAASTSRFRGAWRLRRAMPAWLGTGSVVLAMASASTALFSFIALPGADSAGSRTFFLVCGLTCLALVAGVIVFHRRWNRHYGRRLTPVNPELPAFAEANDLDFRWASTEDASLPPAAGQDANVQRVSLRLRPNPGSGWPAFEIGSRIFHRPVAPDFVATERHPYPITLDEGLFAAVPLPRRLPHIALLRDAELSASNLDLGTQYSMGVEFDHTFTLLCPPGYERDALYLFTPDVMAAMLDDAGSAQWGAEVLDDWLFFRFPESSLPGVVFAEDLERAFLLIERTAGELATQAQRYSDTTAGARSLNRVSREGRRVATRVRPTMIIAAVGFPLLVLAPFAALMIGTLAF